MRIEDFPPERPIPQQMINLEKVAHITLREIFGSDEKLTSRELMQRIWQIFLDNDCIYYEN